MLKYYSFGDLHAAMVIQPDTEGAMLNVSHRESWNRKKSNMLMHI